MRSYWKGVCAALAFGIAVFSMSLPLCAETAVKPVTKPAVAANLAKGTAKIAAVAMDVDYHPQGKTTFARALEYVDKAASQGCNLIVLPEGSVFGLAPKRDSKSFLSDVFTSVTAEDAAIAFHVSEQVPEGPICQAFIRKAKEKNVYIIYNGLERDDEDPRFIFNSEILVGPEGYVGTYHKVHLPAGEQSIMANGEGFKVFDTKLGRIGMMVGYDLVFPESARVMALMGADIIVTSMGWPSGLKANGKESDDKQIVFLESLARSYAITNGVYMVLSNAANPGGIGHSLIVSPDGTVLDQTKGYKEGIATAYIGNAFIEGNKLKYSASFGLNFLKDRRPDCYREISRLQPGCFFNNKDFREAINYATGQR